MLEHIIKVVKDKTQIVQWENTDAAINWFKELQNKQKLLFIQFDVVDFYGSISEDLVKNSLTFAARYVDIGPEVKKTILQAANSFLFSENQEWIKKDGGTSSYYHSSETSFQNHSLDCTETMVLLLAMQLQDR